jgi:hypothetical protein
LLTVSRRLSAAGSDLADKCYSSSWSVSFALRVRPNWELKASR